MSSRQYPRSFRGIRLINIVFLVLTATAVLWGLQHKSSEPDLLGRYSCSYAAFMTALALLVALQLYVLFCSRERTLRWAGNLYTLIIATLFALGLTELALRIFNPWGMNFFHQLPYHMQGMVDHPQLGYVHPHSVNYTLGENRVSLNAQGLRDHEIRYSKTPGQRRALILGDSVTFGWGVGQGETFSDQMEPLLQQQTGEPWEVINAGVNGYNTEQERDWLKIEGLLYAPDIVILVYVGNDTDPVFDPNETTWRRYPTWPPSFPEALHRLRRLSYLFQGTNMFARLRPADDEGDNRAISARHASITNKPRWPQSKQALVDIAQILKERNIPFLVAKSSGQDSQFFEQLEAAGIAATTMAPAWGKVPAEIARVSRVDPHPSKHVHAEMAILLLEELNRRGWLNRN